MLDPTLQKSCWESSHVGSFLQLLVNIDLDQRGSQHDLLPPLDAAEPPAGFGGGDGQVNPDWNSVVLSGV